MDKVMVVQVYTSHKKYCRGMYPKIFDSLTYKNKSAAFIEETQHPELLNLPTGEQRAAAGRQLGIELARRERPEWILFLDLDTEPDVDCIEKMLAVKHPVVGALHCARGNAWRIIGHNYKDRKTLERRYLRASEMRKNPEVDGISGGILLVARGIYEKCDYTGYTGPKTIEGRYTADDEYLLLQIYKKMKIRPRVATNVYSWHYSDDGRAYKLFGGIKIWRA